MIIKKLKKTSWYWIFSGLLLLIFFVLKGHAISQVFYFIAFLLPVIIGTSSYVNQKLIPEYLLRNKIGRFILYLIYTVIISLYLQYLIIFLALYLFTAFQVEQQSIITMNIGNLSLTLYLLVMVKVIMEIIDTLNQKEILISDLQSKVEKPSIAFEDKIIVRYNRLNYSVKPSEIIYIESLSDYIKVVTEHEEIVSKEKISKIIDRLPDHFKRVHRSFIVNSHKIKSYNREYITLNEDQIPISRTYKAKILSYLNTEN